MTQTKWCNVLKLAVEVGCRMHRYPDVKRVLLDFTTDEGNSHRFLALR